MTDLSTEIRDYVQLWTEVKAARKLHDGVFNFVSGAFRFVTASNVIKRLPAIQLPLTASAAGQSIQRYLNSYAFIWRRKYAACILVLPESSDEYLRGRSRQSLRTNLRKVDELQLRVIRLRPEEVSRYTQQALHDQISIRYLDQLANEEPAPFMTTWAALDSNDQIVAFARVTMDAEVAQITYLVSVEEDARSIVRWKLSFEVFAECIRRKIRYVVCDSVFEIDPGRLYFQERLGFRIFRVSGEAKRSSMASLLKRWRQVTTRTDTVLSRASSRLAALGRRRKEIGA